ncbi:unnamed protein product [Arabidopsis arenosa]|uniref:Replication factor A C-terminal domain-containing protein n=1 Tax=Arabidopsis arenosa TaxID=38785 RepID=A0A8S2AU81_ARAAE|nr:unnamed protein product [Arabidopsis arenosa]
MNTTAISRIPSISDDLYFDFANFPDILNVNGLNENILIDVLGQVVSLGEMTTHDVNNKATKRFEFELRDTNDERLTCTLWGRFAERMWDACQNGGNERVICLIRLAKIGTFKGERSISNAFDMSLLEINPNYPAVQDFVNNLPADVPALTIQEVMPKDAKIIKKKAYFQTFPRKTISELFEATEVGKCNVICTILKVDTDYSWYWFSCLKCSKTAYKIPKIENEIVKKGKKPLFWCPTCKEDTPKVLPRYLLNLAVMDNTGNTMCKLFDKTAAEIIGVSAEGLLEGNWDEIKDPTNLPGPIKDLVGKTFLFVVSIGKENINDTDDTYKVFNVWLGNDLYDNDNVEESENQNDQHTDLSIDQEALALTNSSDNTDVNTTSSATPSSKRSNESSDEAEGQSSTTKKTDNTKRYRSRHSDENRNPNINHEGPTSNIQVKGIFNRLLGGISNIPANENEVSAPTAGVPSSSVKRRHETVTLGGISNRAANENEVSAPTAVVPSSSVKRRHETGEDSTVTSTNSLRSAKKNARTQNRPAQILQNITNTSNTDSEVVQTPLNPKNAPEKTRKKLSPPSVHSKKAANGIILTNSRNSLRFAKSSAKETQTKNKRCCRSSEGHSDEGLHSEEETGINMTDHQSYSK